MVSWGQFRQRRPDLAAWGRRLFYGHGVGVGFLATVRADGGPRVHPVCPILTESGLYVMVFPGPKLGDLRRDPRYALHSDTLPPPRQEDAFYVAGAAVDREADRALRQRVGRQLLEERELAAPWPGFDDMVLFELLLERCLLTLSTAANLPAGHTVWRPDG